MTRTTNAPVHLPAVVALSGGAALILGAMTAAPAAAHDTLIGSTPEADAVLDESPEEIVLEFSGEGLTTGESVPNTIWVTGEDGERWDGETETDGPTMSTELPESLPNGEYEVLYHAVYSDGHSEELDFTFEVDAAEVEDEAEDEPTQEQTADTAAPESAADGGEESEEPGTEESAAEESAAAEETDAEETSVDSSAAEDKGEGQFPVAMVLGIGGGVLVLIVVAMLLVRRRVTRADAGQNNQG
ncbi:MAG: copper resistance CopC family protein [Nesterenkonia sp.]